MNHSKTVVCPGCTCLCDDVEATQIDGAFVAKNACQLGRAFFEFASIQPSTQAPAHYVSNHPADLESAINAAARILEQSQAPLICGLDPLTTQAQQVAWKLADQIGATIDTTLTNHGRASMFALQRVGKVTASLGEVANRSDLVVFWFCDPVSSHPRLLERLKRSNGSQRRIVVIDEEPTAILNEPREFLQVARDQAVAVLAVLRSVVKGLAIDADTVRAATGLDLSQLQSLADQMGAAKYGSFFFGQTMADSAFDPVTDSLSLLIRELNQRTRFVGIKLRSDANAQCAEDVLSWSSGYPFAVNNHLGFPRFNWLEHSAETVLHRQECDAVLLATGSDLEQALAGLSGTSREYLRSIPTIALSPIVNFPSTVSIQVSIPGLDGSGEFCRFDGVSLPLTNVFSQATGAVDPKVALEALLQKIGDFAGPSNGDDAIKYPL